MEQKILAMLLNTTGKDFCSLEAALEAYSGRELFEMWLEYEGIIGYTYSILEAVHLLNP